MQKTSKKSKTIVLLASIGFFMTQEGKSEKFDLHCPQAKNIAVSPAALPGRSDRVFVSGTTKAGDSTYIFSTFTNEHNLHGERIDNSTVKNALFVVADLDPEQRGTIACGYERPNFGVSYRLTKGLTCTPDPEKKFFNCEKK